LTGDTDMTQMPDDVLGGEGSGVESVDSDEAMRFKNVENYRNRENVRCWVT
jgi:hypothetical protein